MTREEFVEEIEKLRFNRIFNIKGKAVPENCIAFESVLDKDILVIIACSENNLKDIIEVTMTGDGTSVMSKNFDCSLSILRQLCSGEISSISHYANKSFNNSMEEEKEMANNPEHYGGADNVYEVVKVLEAWGLDKCAYSFSAVKYIARAGKKDPNKEIQDLEKAIWMISRKVNNLKKEQK